MCVYVCMYVCVLPNTAEICKIEKNLTNSSIESTSVKIMHISKLGIEKSKKYLDFFLGKRTEAKIVATILSLLVLLAGWVAWISITVSYKVCLSLKKWLSLAPDTQSLQITQTSIIFFLSFFKS